MSEIQRVYFGGERVQAPIHQLAATNFKEFVERYFNVPVELAYSREEFFALDNDTQNTVKDGPYITGCSFNPGTTKRCDANACQYVLACLDIDPPEEGEPDYAKDFFQTPELVADALYPYNFIFYTTARHTAKRPRVRVIVELEPMETSMQRAVIHHIAKNLLGISTKWSGFRESNVISQPMYRPIKFAGSKSHAVLATRVSGKAMDELDVPELVIDEIQQTYAYKGQTGDSGLAFMPVPDLTVDSVREALDMIDPDIAYKEWCEVASALRHQFREEDDAEMAYHAFDLWSSRGSKYHGEEETAAKWRSFRPDTNGKNPITIRSLFRLAISAGWQPVKLTAQIQKSFSEWLGEQNDGGVIMAEGPGRIAAHPFKNDVIESAMINQMKTRLQAMGSSTVDAAAFKREVSKARKRVRAEEDSDNTPDWLRPWVYISQNNEFYNTGNTTRMSVDAFNNNYSSELMAKEPGEADAGMGRPMILPTHLALNVKKIQRVHGVAYDPRHGGLEPFFEFKGVTYVNSYRHASLPIEDPKNSAKAGEWFSNHVKVLVGEKYAPMVLDFLCHVVQHPGVLIRWCPFIQSAEGAGKGILAKLLAAALGEVNVKAISPEILKSQWNDWQVGAVICVIDEIHVSGERAEAIMDNLKQFITDIEIPINKRNTTASTAPNLMNAIAFTNAKKGIHIKDSDRRYMVIESPIQRKSQVVAMTASGHFEKLDKVIKKYGGALRHWMLNRVISPTFPVNGPAPDTTFRQQMIEDGKNRLQVRIEELIEEEEESLIGDDIIAMHRLTQMSAEEAKNNALPWKYLRDMGFVRYERDGQSKFSVAGERTNIWVHEEFYDETFGPADEILRERVNEKLFEEID